MIGQQLQYIKQLPLKDHHLKVESLQYVSHRCTINARGNSDIEREQASEYLKLHYTALVTN
jgi:hypothetical protein